MIFLIFEIKIDFHEFWEIETETSNFLKMLPEWKIWMNNFITTSSFHKCQNKVHKLYRPCGYELVAGCCGENPEPCGYCEPPKYGTVVPICEGVTIPGCAAWPIFIFNKIVNGEI